MRYYLTRTKTKNGFNFIYETDKDLQLAIVRMDLFQSSNAWITNWCKFVSLDDLRFNPLYRS